MTLAGSRLVRHLSDHVSDVGRLGSTTNPWRGADAPIPRPQRDAAWFFSIWLVLLYSLHARLVLPGLGSVGSPAALLALGAGLWWLTGRLMPSSGLDQDAQPVRTALFVYTGYLVASYGVGATRSLTALEQSGSSRAQILLFAYVSVALLAMDGVRDLERLRTLLRRLTTIGALFAAYGILQSILGEAHLFAPPGLTWNQEIEADVLERGGFARPIASAMHPIEFAVLVGSLLPLAIHFVLHPRTRIDRYRAWAELSLLVLAVPVSLSRSAVVCAAVAILVLAFGWTWRRRVLALLTGLIIVPIVASLVPAVFSFMVDLFTGADTDPSVQDRIERIPAIMALIRERPWFGWGYGTYSVEDFFLIDNQLWVTLIATGILGLAVTLLLPAVAGVAAIWHARAIDGPAQDVADLGRSIAASIAGLMASTITFTAFSYRTLSFTLFLLIGCAGAHWRLTRPSRIHDGAGEQGAVTSPGGQPEAIQVHDMGVGSPPRERT